MELDGEEDAWQFYADQVDIFTDESLFVAVGNVVYVADGARLACARDHGRNVPAGTEGRVRCGPIENKESIIEK